MDNRYLQFAKRTDIGEWVSGNRIDDGVTGKVFIHAAGNSVNESDKVGEDGCLKFFAFEVDPDTVCQCTGNQDKNGKLIKDKDIVKYNNKFECEKTKPIGVVAWEKAKWVINWIYDDSLRTDLYYWVTNRNIEIIGNLIDNPELLERNSGIDEIIKNN